LYASEEAIFGPLDPVEKPLIAELVTELSQTIPTEAQVVCPLGVGGHVDHRLTVRVAKSLRQPLWFYAEIPYVNRAAAWIGGASPLLQDAAWEAHLIQLGSEDLKAWQEAVAGYASQLRVFWPSVITMRAGLTAYLEDVGGARLWRQILDEA
jgi:LmbE family N-acetylglucosaminyl deacetylase